jgi:AcrR family transcriptional regulator
MDRRQKKTREAIFNAFCELLSKKHYNRITVGEIIDRADVGRATFYAHFETKDFLLKELCEELFCHIFDAAEGGEGHKHIFECEAPASVFLHLLQHLQKNDHNMLSLLTCENNGLFLGYFQENLKALIEKELDTFSVQKPEKLPDSFWINHISATFVEAIRWWIEQGMKESPETLAEYFMLAI